MNKPQFKSHMRSHKILYLSITLLILTGAFFGYTLMNNSSLTKKAVITEISQSPDKVDQNALSDNKATQESMLLYLIEEEKLAHDVYTVMHEIYGAQVFGNILKSEDAHQKQVLVLLQARNIDDPRSDELGTFKNPELQELYSALVDQGKQNVEGAFKAGIAIEEKDIADITMQLATATDTDIVSTLEELRKGSENHLRAFNRQIKKY